MSFKNPPNPHQRSANDRLKVALTNKDQLAIASALKQGADPNLKGQNLLRAVYSGKVEILQLLVAAGGDLALKKGASMSWAALRGDLPMIKWLVSQGVKLEYENVFVDSPLENAVRNNHPEVVRYLLQQGDNRHLNAEAALREALSNDLVEMVQLLVDPEEDLKRIIRFARSYRATKSMAWIKELESIKIEKEELNRIPTVQSTPSKKIRM